MLFHSGLGAFFLTNIFFLDYLHSNHNGNVKAFLAMLVSYCISSLIFDFTREDESDIMMEWEQEMIAIFEEHIDTKNRELH